jgi:hypothetical protein
MQKELKAIAFFKTSFVRLSPSAVRKISPSFPACLQDIKLVYKLFVRLVFGKV